MEGTGWSTRPRAIVPPLGRWLARAREVHREHGAIEVLRRAAFQIFKYDWEGIYALGGRSEPACFPAELEKIVARLGKALRLEVLDRPESELLPGYLTHRRDLSAEQVTGWLRDGHVTVLVRRGDRIVGDSWLAVERYPVPDPALAELLERGGYAFSFLAQVDPEFQGVGIFPLLISEQLRLMRRKGRTRLLGTVAKNNLASMRSVEKMGFRRVGTLHLCWVLGRKLGRARWDDTL